MFSRVFIDVFLPDMRFPHVFIDIWPLEFLGFGSLWVPFGPWIDVFSCVYWHFPSWHEVFSWVYQHLTLRIPWLWIPWVPFGPLWGHCGSPWPPLGTILDDFCIVFLEIFCEFGQWFDRCFTLVLKNISMVMSVIISVIMYTCDDFGD